MNSRNHPPSPYARSSTGSAAVIAHPEDPALILLRLLLPLALLLLSLQSGFVRSALAHAVLVTSQPEGGTTLESPPERVVANFSEELDSGASSMRVLDASGAQVDNGDGGVDLDDLAHLSLVVTLPPLPAGTYIVRWHALSVDDGDESDGSFSFTAGGGAVAASPAAQPAGSSSRLMVGAIAAGILLLAAFSAIYLRQQQRVSVEP